MMPLTRCFLFVTLTLLTAVGAVYFWTQCEKTQILDRLGSNRAALVRQLGLTDLALWSEARYTRHPSLADFFTPFQEFPGSLEHFPAGSLINPPPRTTETVLKIRRENQAP